MIRFCDMSAIGKLRISGTAAHDFIRTMFTADTALLEELGGATVSLLLTGEAEIIDVVLIIRTGDEEYMVTTSPQVVDEAFEWLKAHSTITDDNGAVFEGLELTNQTEALANVVLFGEGSREILDELSGYTFSTAPHTGRITLVQLDTVVALAFESLVLPGVEAYELFCPPAGAEGLKYVFMSFPEIDPLELEEYRALRVEAKTWFENASDASYIFPDEAKLLHLTRSSMDFVGAKALSQRQR
jgi:glycine cleavage system aminomethyltransferase T